MRIDTLELTVEAKLTISDQTIERCLKVVEMWLEDNPDKFISGGFRGADGKTTPFRIERRADDE